MTPDTAPEVKLSVSEKLSKLFEGVNVTFSAWCISGIVPDCRCNRCLKERGITPTALSNFAARKRSLRRTRAFRVAMMNSAYKTLNANPNPRTGE